MSNYQVIDPYTEETSATYPTATPAKIEKALTVGNAYYQATRHQGFAGICARSAQLQRLAVLFKQNENRLAEMATTNMGKLLRESHGEINGSIGVANYYAHHGAEALQPRMRQYQGVANAQISYEPTGIVLAIEPWNFPYTQVMRVFAPNFILGNPVILKHAPSVASCALLFAEMVQAAGIAPAAMQNLFLTNEQAATVIADSRVQGVALTGSVRAGRTIASEAAQALTKSTLELGGNDAFIVLADADVPAAAAAAVGSRLRNAGQVCVSAKRFIVHQAVAPAFTAAVKAAFAQQKIGDPRAEDTTLAPLASAEVRQRIQAQVDQAVAHGAEVLVAGGSDFSQPGYFFKPVLLGNIKSDNPIFDAELFGPVGQLHIVESDDAAITLANRSQYGLAGTVFGAVEHAQAIAAQMETGQIFINQQAVAQPELPFGGVKNSGYGREMSEQALFEFANQKVIAH
ncbi:aldehyde dehydrogenase family protein [Loigolactobacillus zhaoyuanensis]|uniref:Aldehyde dehydrogenase family protein n=1 Tax=Loigolactobacillus zhaoyuanensis TaxID=2486017 RepID=A0ABW8UA36_9LACO